MKFSKLCFALMAAVIALTACHSAPPAASVAASGQPQAKPALPTVSAPDISGPPEAAPPAPKPKLTTSLQHTAQLDLDTEGGVKDGSYAMWVHVTERGRSLPNLRVLAFHPDNKLAAAARTNQDGDAMLKVQATTYRITATQGGWHAEQTVTYHPGNQFELTLRH